MKEKTNKHQKEQKYRKTDRRWTDVEEGRMREEVNRKTKESSVEGKRQ